MGATTQQTRSMRQELRSLLPDVNPSDRARYEALRYQFISSFEGRPRNDAYDDANGKSVATTQPTGNVTVGIGFNMDTDVARRDWAAAFGENAPDFDQVRAGKLNLTDTQIETLFTHGLKVREKYLKEELYPGAWEKFTPNERMAIESMYFNGGEKLVGQKKEGGKVVSQTHFLQNMRDYGNNGNTNALTDTLWEVKNNSNGNGMRGLQLRRDAEVELLNTYNANLNQLAVPNYVPRNRRGVQPRSDIPMPYDLAEATIPDQGFTATPGLPMGKGKGGPGVA